MTVLHPPPLPIVGLGLSSLTLGTVGLVLFFLPILGLPISAIGLAIGLAGVGNALLGGSVRLRMAYGGTWLSLLAVGVNAAILIAPNQPFPAPVPELVPHMQLRERFVAPPAPLSQRESSALPLAALPLAALPLAALSPATLRPAATTMLLLPLS
jgi:hypothetical protein